MRILITGANGQLGRELVKQLQGTEFLATDVNELDITNQQQALDCIRAYRPDAVIHSAAFTNVDGAENEPELAYKINAIGTQNVAAACLHCDAKMVYVSTDYVFDGMLGRAYNEFDQPNPQSVYGKTKYAGEILAKHILNKLFVVRTSWLYGEGDNFVRTMLRFGQEKTEIKVVNDQHGCPTSTVDLARTILYLLPTEHFGTYHAVNNGTTTWYDFAKKIFEFSGNTTIQVLPQTTKELGRPASRPPYSSLDSLMLRLLGYPLRDWQPVLKEYISAQKK